MLSGHEMHTAHQSCSRAARSSSHHCSRWLFVCLFFDIFLGLDRSKSEAGCRVGDVPGAKAPALFHHWLLVTKSLSYAHQNEEKILELVNNSSFSKNVAEISTTH